MPFNYLGEFSLRTLRENEYAQEYTVFELAPVKTSKDTWATKVILTGPFNCEVLEDSCDGGGYVKGIVPKGYKCVVSTLLYNYYGTYVKISYNGKNYDVKADNVAYRGMVDEV